MECIKMTTQKEMSRINDLVETIEKHGPISNVQLVIRSRIGISYFEKLRPFLLEIYPHKVRYNKSTKLWHTIKSEQIENNESENSSKTADSGTKND